MGTTGTAASGSVTGGGLVTAPAIEPITLAELKLHLRIDSGSFADNVDESQLLPPGSHAHTAAAVYTLLYETLTLDVAPGGAGWSAGETLTGASSTKTCIIVEKLTTKTYIIKNRTGAFTLGEIISNGADTADQGAAYPTFTSAKVEVLGYTALVTLTSGLFTTGTADVKIQESDDGDTWTDWATAFTQVSTAAGNDNSIQEIAYTGTKRYIRTAAKVLIAACPISTTVIRLTATTVEDDLLSDLITTARMEVESDTRRALITQTWDYYLDKFPACNYIKLPLGNLATVTHVKYTDSDGDQTTMTVTTEYLVETNGENYGRIILPYGVTWPSFTEYPSKAVVIRFVCGYGNAASDVPAMAKAAIKRRCALLYFNRGASDDITDKTYDRLIDNIPRLYAF